MTQAKISHRNNKGEILGILYDGQNWTWQMPNDKGLRLMVQIGEAIRSGYIKNGDAVSLAGKINHYSNMVNGKFNRCLLVHLGNADADKNWEPGYAQLGLVAA